VVGDSFLAGNTEDHATIWNGTTPTDLGTLGGTISGAFGINETGQVVGYSYTAGNTTFQATIWNGTTVTVLNTLGGGNGLADAINNAGQVAGYSSTSSGAIHAALWYGIVPIDLGTLGTLPLSAANGLNDKGQVVGSSYTPAGPGIAVLWQDGKPIDLNTLIAGPLAVRVTLNSASAINNSGLIVGFGTDSITGEQSGYVLTPIPVALAALLTEATGVGPGKSLANKVALAQSYYAAKDVQATCAMLTAFVNEVQAQAGKKISPQLDAKLIGDTQAIEAAIGCN
jgi:probable HAF family extracellular repeat protein